LPIQQIIRVLLLLLLLLLLSWNSVQTKSIPLNHKKSRCLHIFNFCPTNNCSVVFTTSSCNIS